jgi:hypothetical protein
METQKQLRRLWTLTFYYFTTSTILEKVAIFGVYTCWWVIDFEEILRLGSQARIMQLTNSCTPEEVGQRVELS